MRFECQTSTCKKVRKKSQGRNRTFRPALRASQTPVYRATVHPAPRRGARFAAQSEICDARQIAAAVILAR